jgi:HEAT repeat protein
VATSITITVQGEGEMAEESDRLQKLITIATDLNISRELRTRAIIQLGRIGTHEALEALLNLVGDEAFVWEERMLALKQAERIIKPQQPWWYFLKPRSRS